MKPWNYTQNPFLNATDGSYLNAMGISTYHDSALAAVSGDTFIVSLYTSFHPLHLAYKSAYDTWMAQGGTQQSETLNLSQLLQLLSNKIKQWDIKIQNLYPQNTTQYKKLLPGRRGPFQTGSQTERISAVKALSQSIGADEDLAAVKTDIDAFYAQLDGALTTQKGSLSSTKSKSTGLEAARVEMCTGMFANLGALIQKYASAPENIGQYFDLKSIRNGQQVTFTGHVKAGEVYSIVKHTFAENDELWLSNTGNSPLNFYLAGVKDAKPDGTPFTLAPGEQKVAASALGKVTNTYLMVQNPDALLNGEFEVEIL